MKIEIHDCKPEPKEKKITVKLLPGDSPGGVKLCVVDEKGNRKDSGTILTITSSGEVKLYPSLGDYGLNWEDQNSKCKK